MILVCNIHHASPSEKVFPHLTFSQSLHSTQLRQNSSETLKWIVIHLPWTWKLIMAALIPKWTWCLNALIYLGAAWQSASHPGLNGPDDLSPWKICINSHLLPYWFLSVCNLLVRPGCVFHVVFLQIPFLVSRRRCTSEGPVSKRRGVWKIKWFIFYFRECFPVTIYHHCHWKSRLWGQISY